MLTKHQRSLVIVLGLAGSALAADRFLLTGGGPRSANAESLLIDRPAVASSGATQTQAKAGSLVNSSSTSISVADRLETLRVVGPEPEHASSQINGFSLPASWGEPFAVVHSAPTQVDRSAAPTLRLTAVMTNRADQSLVAVINGKAYSKGETIDDLTITELSRDGLVLMGPSNNRVELRIQSPNNERATIARGDSSSQLPAPSSANGALESASADSPR